jgi:hypothetical protein
MTELSGTLEGVGLPAIVRFLVGLRKTGALRISHQDWRGGIYFVNGRATCAQLGSRGGLQALDALVQALPGASFAFDPNAAGPENGNIDLSREALLAHLDELAAATASGGPVLPSLDSVPRVVPQHEAGSEHDTVPLDRGTLQTLLAIDGVRTVRELIAVRGSFEALWQVANLCDAGLVRLNPLDAATRPEKPPMGREAPGAGARLTARSLHSSTERFAARAAGHGEPPVQPVPPVVPPPANGSNGSNGSNASNGIAADHRDATDATDATDAPAANGATDALAAHSCPMLGFEDDASNSYGRPTRLHRCFATGTPLPLSLDQQRELCLSDQHATCPRLAMAGPSAAGSAAVSPTPPTDTPRIVRLPLGGRARPTAQTSAPPTDSASAAATPPPPAPTPLRARAVRAVPTAGAASTPHATPVKPVRTPTTLEPRTEGGASTPPRRPSTPSSVPADNTPAWRQSLGSLPLPAIAAGLLAVLLVVGVAVLIGPSLLAGDQEMDLSSLPNASAVASGTPVAQLGLARPTAGAAADATSAADNTADTADDSSAQATMQDSDPSMQHGDSSTQSGASTQSAPAADAQSAAPTADASRLASPTATTAQSIPAASAKSNAAASVQSNPPASVQSTPAPALASSRTVLRESFADNSRGWPNNTQGVAWLTQGALRLEPRQAKQFLALAVPTSGDVPADVTVSGTFRKLGGPAGGGYGFLVRDQGPGPRDGANQNGRYYVLEVGDKGEVGIWRRETDRWVDLLPWQHTDAVRPGVASNDVTVRASGERLSLVVNGTEVGSSQDATLASGNVGVFVGGDGNQVTLENLSVTTP